MALRAWLSAEDLGRGLALAALLPGPEALKLVIYCGWRLHGTRGGIVAGLGFLLPSVLLLLLLSWIYVSYGSLPVVSAALKGLAAAVIALIAHALWRLAPRLLSAPWLVLLALSAFIALAVFAVPFPLVVGLAIFAGVLSAARTSESRIFGRLHVLAGVPARRTVKLLAAGVMLALLPAAALYAAGGMSWSATRVYASILQVSAVAFGGAYPALAYANQQFVQQLDWVTPEQAAAALALAETTPGPLVIALQFLGFMAGWNNPAPFAAQTSAVLAALAASWAIFMPSFVLMLLAAPFLETLQRDRRAFAAMTAITAVTFAAIAQIGWQFARTTLWSAAPAGVLQPGPVLIALVALSVLITTRTEAHWIVLGGAAAGVAVEVLGR